MIALGTKTPHGIVSAVLWIGERYYLLSSNGAVKLLPATVVEK